MKKGKLSIPFSMSEITDIKEINSSFATGTLKIMYTGKNRNGSYFDREDVIRALPSLYNIPIVANYNRNAGKVGGHDIELLIEGDEMKLINTTHPCGVVPEHAEFDFEILPDENGNFHEYLVARNVILWRRQEVYDFLMEKCDGKIAHSMEINISDGFFDESDELYHITDFQFEALCLLGEGVKPCFEGSELNLFSESLSNVRSEFMDMMTELRGCYSMIFSSESDVEDKDEQKGGEEMPVETSNEELVTPEVEAEEIEEKVLEETALTEEATETEEVSDQVEVEVVEPIEESVNEEPEEEFNVNVDAVCDVVRDADYSILRVEEKNDGLVRVYAVHEEHLYAIDAMTEGDALRIDFESRRPVHILFMETGIAENVPFATVRELISKNAIEEFAQKTEVLNAELEELRAYKAEIENAKALAERYELMNTFYDLADLQEFADLKEKCMDYSLDELTLQLYAMRGRQMMVPNKKETFSVDENTVKIVINKNVDNRSEEPYGDLFKRYGFKRQVTC